MIKYDKEQNLMVELLEVQRPLPIDIIQEYDHKKVMKDVKKIIETLTDNYFYQVAYQEFLKYEIDDNLKMVILEDPEFQKRPFSNTLIKDDTTFKYFTRTDYRNSIELCELLIKRIKDSYNNLDEIERFIIYNFELANTQEYKDESFCAYNGIHKDKYYLSKKSAYIKMAIQLGLTIEEDMDKSMREIMLKYIDKNMIKTFSC